MNKELLREIKKMILEEPRRLNMLHFASLFKDSHQLEGDWVRQSTEEERPPCGAVMCIAGHTLVAEERMRGFFRKRFTPQFVKRVDGAAESEAQKLLGLTLEQSVRLFYFKGWCEGWYAYGWPTKFSDAYEKAKTPLQRAKVTARRIDHFLKTNGAE